MQGRTVLLIGGDCRPDQTERLQDAFPHTAFLWQPTRESDASVERYSRTIERPDIDVVVLIFGLNRTKPGQTVRRLCSTLRKPLLYCRRPTPGAIVKALLSSRIGPGHTIPSCS